MADMPDFSRRRGGGDGLVPKVARNNTPREALDAHAQMVHGAAQIHGAETIDEVEVGVVNDTAELDERDEAATEACTASGADGIIMAGKSKEQRERAFEKCARVIANPDEELAKRASCAGAVPGRPLDASAVRAALSLIARSARDLFGTVEHALSYLDRDDFGGTGLSTRELLVRGRATYVIARLDELRFGSRG
jgi:hypothetical protein